MTAMIGEACLLGVSTRKMERLVQTLWISHLSKSQLSEMAKDLDQMVTKFCNRPLDAGGYPYVWLDALVMRCRDGNHIVNLAVVVDTGVNTEGRREILGMDVFTTEDGTAWSGPSFENSTMNGWSSGAT